MSIAVVAHDRCRVEDGEGRARRRSRKDLPSLVGRLACPATGSPLALADDGAKLVGDGRSYPLRDGVPLLLEGEALGEALAWQPTKRRGMRDRVRAMVPAPVSARRQNARLAEFLSGRRPHELVLNVGSGGWDLGPGVWNLDRLPFANVDLCGDVHRMPFGRGRVDAIVCTGLLEHVPDPEAVVAEFHRVLRPGGAVFCTVPFLQAYHQDPEDYRRYTATGLRRLFSDFTAAEVRPSHGVGSTLAWVVPDALAAALALGSNRLHTALVMSLRCLLAPLRLLDRLSEGSRFEHVACSALLIEAER